jgi:hypothetical protein
MLNVVMLSVVAPLELLNESVSSIFNHCKKLYILGLRMQISDLGPMF